MKPNSYKVYMCPVNYLDMFVYEGRRYYLTASNALVSDYGSYGMLPPAGKGFYLVLSKKEFKEKKALYLSKQESWFKAVNCGYVKEAPRIQNSLF